MQQKEYKPKVIVLTGPESTGKSTLSVALAKHLGGVAYPEYARQYLEEHSDNNEYNYDDIERIAKGQLAQYEEAMQTNKPYVFLDTWLIITKVWFRWVYKDEPAWLEQAIQDMPIDYYLLCTPDIEWVEDPMRENGGDARQKLFEEYKQELQSRKLAWGIVEGDGEQRLKNAMHQLQKAFS